MILHLVKKDYLLIKNFFLGSMVFMILIPIYLSSKLAAYGSFGGFLGFASTATYILLLNFNFIALAEMKFKNAHALLCTLPYSRNMMVQSRYLFSFLLICLEIGIYFILSILLPTIFGQMYFVLISLYFLYFALTIGIILPLEYRFGYERIQIFCMAFMIGQPFVLSYIVKSIFDRGVNVSELFSSAPIIIAIISLLLAASIYFLSMYLSIRIYEKKEF